MVGGDRVVTKKIILLSPPVNNTNLINLFTRHCTYQSPSKIYKTLFSLEYTASKL